MPAPSSCRAKTCTTKTSCAETSRRLLGAGVRVADGLGALSVVGAGINATYANVRRGSACLRDNGISSRGLSTSSFRATWLVERNRLDDAVRLLHEAFIEQNEARVP